MKNQTRPVIGIMGPGDPGTPKITTQAEKLGRLIAENGWALLTGGRAAGVMEAASRGAAEAGGTVIGILPDHDKRQQSAYVNIPIPTGMGSARNVINILAADVVIICGMGLGTASEAALAIKQMKPVIFTCIEAEQASFFEKLCNRKQVTIENAEELIQEVKNQLAELKS